MKVAMRRAVLERDNYTCLYCGKYLKGKTRWAGFHRHGGDVRKSALHVDHLFPKSLGGSDEMDNLITACHGCNLAKYNRTDVMPACIVAIGAFLWAHGPTRRVA